MKGSGGWSDSLTCSISGCRGRRGYRGSGSRTSRCSSPFLLLPQRNLLPCLPQSMLLLQLQSEKGESRHGVNEEVRHSRPLARRFFFSFSLVFSLSLNIVLLTVRASRETWGPGRRAAEEACRDCISVRTEDMMAVRETTAVLSFHIAPSTTVPLTCDKKTRKINQNLGKCSCRTGFKDW